MLDPELRAGLLDESLHRSPARERLVAVDTRTEALPAIYHLVANPIDGGGRQN